MTPFDGTTSLSLIENISYVVISVDRDGIINYWNKAAEVTLGFKAEEAIGQHANLVIPADMQQVHGNCFTRSQAIVTGFALKKDVVLPFIHKSGAPIKLRGHAAILRSPDGLPQGSAVIGSKAE
ncbi:MAG: PAS domain-containing protein [Betaproteobacteria bacterium]|nr:PAS domain-containing protein [Betaproteobacteria bacterium]